MNKRLRVSKWLAILASSVLIVVMVLCGVMYLIDPFFQYRVRDNIYLLNPLYAGAGLIKNADYDTLIIGSSMTQNFNMDTFRRELSVEPLHVGIGGLNTRETIELLKLGERAGKAENCYVCIDLPNFVQMDESKLLDYLIEDTLLSKLEYALSFEAWFYYIPMDACYAFMRVAGRSVPQGNMSIDRMGEWGSGFSFGRDVVLSNYRAKRYDVSSVELENLYENMTANVDALLAEIQNLGGMRYTFFFPPYSALYWCDAQEKGYYDTYMRVKAYFVERATAMGCRVYDFQSEEFILDLAHYRDMTHYDPGINDWMVHEFASEECVVTPQNSDECRKRLDENTQRFREENRELF